VPLAARSPRAGPSPQGPKIRIHRVWAPVYRQYTVPAAVGCDETRMRLMTLTLDTGAGPSIIWADALPKGREKRLHRRPHLSHIEDANKNPISARGMITLRLSSGGFSTDVDSVFVKRRAVPVLLGTSFINRHVEALYPRRQRVRWSTDASVPILSCTACGKRERRRSPRDATVRLALRRVLSPRSRTAMLVTANLAGQVLVTPYNRLNKRHRCQTARGLVVVVPGQRFSVEVANLGDELVCLRKGTVIATVSPVDNVDCMLVPDDAASPAEAAEAVLDQLDLSGVPDRLLPDVPALIRWHACMLDGTLGSIDATVHRVNIQAGTKAIRKQPYRAGHHARDMIRDAVNRMLESKVVRPSTSEWDSSVVVVPKKDGLPRFCVDYRRLNAVTETDSYPIPRKEDFIDSLGDARVFSTLDCNASYWQIPMAPDDIDKTAFTCHIGTYEFLKMAFGPTNSPATFQRALDNILSRMTWQTCLVYLDDVIVLSDTPESHVKALGESLTRLGRAGVTLKAKKCQFFQTSVEYLGHIISPGEMRVHKKNLEALAKVGHPRTKTQLRSFLGMCNVYRHFFANYARIAAPLNQLTTKAYGDTLPAFTETQAAAFTRLRDALLHPPVLALPRRGAPFTIDVDACDTQLGCAVLQEQPDS